MKFFKFAFLIVISLSLLIACAQQIQDRADEQLAEKKQKQASDLNAKMGLNYLEAGDFVLAKEKLLIALEKNPSSFYANSAMAYYDERTGNIKSAEAYYLKALRLAEVKGAAENNYGTFLCRQKRYADAERYFQLAIKDPNYINTAKAYENAALCAELIPDTAKAILNFEKALQNDPNLTISMLHLAKIYSAQNENQKAYEYLQTYLLLEKHPSRTIVSLALELAQKVDDQEKVSLYQSQLNRMSQKK
jgi:type IV pilus assembly protein PilF